MSIFAVSGGLNPVPGLAGIVGNIQSEDKEEILRRMLQALRHEERYSVDRYVSENFCGGRVHIGIFNPYSQPIRDDESRLVGFLDGKLFELDGTKDRPKTRGVGHGSRNDLELCLQLYRQNGERFAESLNGSFVLLVFDERRNSLTVATDRFGLRPIYYAMDSDRLIFASEIKAILQDRTVPRDLDKSAVIDFLQYGEILGNKTFFKSIKILPPAVVGTYSDGKFLLSTYWKIRYRPDRTRSRDDFVKGLTEAFMRAVQIRMKENLRYGLSLSGGLDSRTILATMLKKGLLGRVQTFTHSVSGSDELKIAKESASVAGARHKEIILDARGLIHFAEDAVYRTDGMANILHCYILDCFDRISKDIDVSFHGLAGDLLLGGSYLEERILNSANDEQFFDAIQRKMTVFTPDMLSRLLTPDFLGSNEIDYDESLHLALSSVQEAEAGNRADSFFLQNHVRRLTRLGGVLYRSKCEEATPTYDNDFVDLVLTVPPELRKDHKIFVDVLKRLSPRLARVKYAKYMAPADSSPIGWRIGARILSLRRRLRNLIARISSGRVSLADHHHFVNFGHWFRSDPQWRGLLHDLLLDRSSRTRGFFNRDFVERLIHDHLTGRSDNTIRLANLITFELFLREFGDSIYPSFPTISV